LCEELRQTIVAHATQSTAVSTHFFAENAGQIALASLAMARRFHCGGRLLIFGNGRVTTDAQHIAVEFVHPVLMGKQALPAMALTNDTAVVTGITRDAGFEEIFARQMRVLGGPHDIAMGLATDGNGANVRRALEMARAMGLLTLEIAGGEAGQIAPAAVVDYGFLIPSGHPLLIQEALETLYHILWEQVQLFLEQKGLLEQRPGVAAEAQEVDRFSQLFYPFLHEERQESIEALLTEIAHSTLEKSHEIAALRLQVCHTCTDVLLATAVAMTRAFGNGKQLFVFGNGGSATDAQNLAADCMHPPLAHRRTLPAMSLTNDVAVLSALANDVGFENIFSRQLIAFGRPGDMALGISTSGHSENLLVAFETAKRLGLLSIGLAGYDGGQMARAAMVDYCLVVPSSSVHRIQEVQGTVLHTLWELVQRLLETQVERRSDTQ
jgi:D-sedoheptulose 7-phosphate isomerase